ncbi:hypothetical protein [Lacipirellula parvula]|uniref:Uncharacterized protein n=1 Tax=Lacipirellula parvula TaxID=2650471 RepID=A0A5K7XBP7_9BACT|nr:hypothetical protein [Lacipirellula parvula]BBO32281.1 hypothetical protein PLANPX_1893 [Lacipirellula parvula]
MHQNHLICASDEFEVFLTGEMVACRSLEDAVAVKAADDILSGNDLTAYQAVYLERLVRVLLGYGRVRAACLLSGSFIGLLSQCLTALPYAEVTTCELAPSSEQAVLADAVKSII